MNNKSLKVIQGVGEILIESSILPLLPKPKEKRLGLLRGDVAKKLNIKPDDAGIFLRKMKQNGEVRCYKGRWRRA